MDQVWASVVARRFCGFFTRCRATIILKSALNESRISHLHIFTFEKGGKWGTRESHQQLQCFEDWRQISLPANSHLRPRRQLFHQPVIVPLTVAKFLPNPAKN